MGNQHHGQFAQIGLVLIGHSAIGYKIGLTSAVLRNLEGSSLRKYGNPFKVTALFILLEFFKDRAHHLGHKPLTNCTNK